MCLRAAHVMYSGIYFRVCLCGHGVDAGSALYNGLGDDEERLCVVFCGRRVLMYCFPYRGVKATQRDYHGQGRLWSRPALFLCGSSTSTGTELW